MLTAMCSRGGAGRHIAYPRHDKGAWNTTPCTPHSLVKLATRRWVRRSWAAGAWCCEAGQGDARRHIAGPFSNRRAYYLRFYLPAFIGMHGDGHNSAHRALRLRFQGQHLGGGLLAWCSVWPEAGERRRFRPGLPGTVAEVQHDWVIGTLARHQVILVVEEDSGGSASS
jgi:hypothetical protein